VPVCGAAWSEQLELLECRNNGLQLRRDAKGGLAFLLVTVQEVCKVRQKALLGLHDLLLERVNLYYQYTDLSRITRGIEKRFELLLSLGDPLEQRSDSGLPGLQQLFEDLHLCRLKLQELDNDLKRARRVIAALSCCRLHLLQHGADVQPREIRHRNCGPGISGGALRVQQVRAPEQHTE